MLSSGEEVALFSEITNELLLFWRGTFSWCWKVVHMVVLLSKVCSVLACTCAVVDNVARYVYYFQAFHGNGPLCLIASYTIKDKLFSLSRNPFPDFWIHHWWLFVAQCKDIIDQQNNNTAITGYCYCTIKMEVWYNGILIASVLVLSLTVSVKL